MLILLCLVSILCMALIGWLRGATTLGIGLFALLSAGVLAIPLGGLGSPIARAMGCPELLLPAFGPLVAGLISLIILLALFTHLYKKRRGEQKAADWDKPVGAMIGGVWGLVLTLFCFIGLNTIARADRAMREAAVVSRLRVEARTKIEKEVTREMASEVDFYAPEEFEERYNVAVERRMKTFKIAPQELEEKVEPGALDGFLEELHSFPMNSVVENWSVINSDSEQVLRNLSIVVGDPILFDRFQRNEKVAALMSEPALQALGQDEEIATAIRDQRFRDLLDHPKIVRAARDESLRRKIEELDLESVLENIVN